MESDEGHRRASSSQEGPLIPIEELPWYHRFVINWLITDPHIYNKSDNRRVAKNYQAQNYDDSHNLYLFGGRWRTLKHRPIDVAVGAMLLLPAIVFWAAEAKWWWHRYSPSVVILFTYIWCICFALFINAAVADPGTMPRNIHVPGALGPDNGSSSSAKVIHPPDEYFNTITLPHKKNPTKGVTVKYCSTCHIWRPPRCHHCSKCNCCVINHDHHCQFLNNCVGGRNSKAFYWFLLTSTSIAAYVIGLLFVHMFSYRYEVFRRREEAHGVYISTFGQSIAKYPMTLFLVIFTIPAVIYPFLLLGLHVFLTAQNLTTREYLNDVRHNDAHFNVYDTGSIWRNWYVNWIGKNHGISLVKNTDDYVKEDLRFAHIAPLESWDNGK